MNRARIAIGSAAVAAVVLVGAGVAVSNRAPVAPAAAEQPQPAAVESTCGLPGSSRETTEGAAAVTWEQAGVYSLPISTTDGPGNRVPSGPWSCFTRSQSGAVLAGLVISWRASGAAENWQDVIHQQTMPGPGQQAALQLGLGNTEQVTVRGFHVSAYTDDRATIRYYLRSPAIDATCTEDLAWSEGDWRLVLGDDGSKSSGCVQGAPADFTPWGP